MALDARLARLGPNQRALLEERLHQGPVSGHRLVAQSLRTLNVTHVYGVPGSRSTTRSRLVPKRACA